MAPRRRRPRAARRPEEELAVLRAVLIARYAQDADFGEALESLYGEFCEKNQNMVAWAMEPWQIDELRWRQTEHATWADAYLTELKHLAQGFGLDRLGADDSASNRGYHPSDGEILIHAWCNWRAYYALRLGRTAPPSDFGSMASFPSGRPDFGTLVLSEKTVVQRTADAQTVVVYEERRPFIRIEIDDEWDPREEPLHKAKARLRTEAIRQIEDQLERIASQAEDVGYEFPDTNNAVRDVEMLFWRLRHRWTYREIAERMNDDLREMRSKPKARRATTGEPLPLREVTSETVRTAVVRMADKIGITRRDA